MQVPPSRKIFAERMFTGEPPYLSFPEVFSVRWCIFLSLESGFTLLWKPISAAWLQKATKEENSEDKKSVTEETLVASLHQTKVHIVYHQKWLSDPSNHEESIGASRQNILRTEERGLLYGSSDRESPDDCDENYSCQIMCECKLCWNVQHLLSLQFDGMHWSTSVWSLWDSRAIDNKRANEYSSQHIIIRITW